MGLVYEEITLRNAVDVFTARRGITEESEVRETTVRALVDTGAGTLVINEDVRRQLGLELVKSDGGRLANGTWQAYSLTEPVQVQWKDRDMVCEAIFLPDADEILLGAIPLEAMDLIVNPANMELIGAHGDRPVHRI